MIVYFGFKVYQIAWCEMQKTEDDENIGEARQLMKSPAKKRRKNEK